MAFNLVNYSCVTDVSDESVSDESDIDTDQADPHPAVVPHPVTFLVPTPVTATGVGVPAVGPLVGDLRPQPVRFSVPTPVTAAISIGESGVVLYLSLIHI